MAQTDATKEHDRLIAEFDVKADERFARYEGAQTQADDALSDLANDMAELQPILGYDTETRNIVYDKMALVHQRLEKRSKIHDTDSTGDVADANNKIAQARNNKVRAALIQSVQVGAEKYFGIHLVWKEANSIVSMCYPANERRVTPLPASAAEFRQFVDRTVSEHEQQLAPGRAARAGPTSTVVSLQNTIDNAAQPKASSSSAGNVYLLRHGDTHWYKIGRTINTAAKRICHGLATGNPEGLTEIASWYCETRHSEFETLLHAKFAKYHMSGRMATEFFDFTTIDGDIVELINREHENFIADLIDEQPQLQTSDEYKCSTEQIEELLSERRQLSSTIKMAEIRMKTVDLLLKQYIGGHAGLLDANDRPAITWKTQQRQIIDTPALRTAHPDIATAFTKTSESRVFKSV